MSCCVALFVDCRIIWRTCINVYVLDILTAASVNQWIESDPLFIFHHNPSTMHRTTKRAHKQFWWWQTMTIQEAGNRSTRVSNSMQENKRGKERERGKIFRLAIWFNVVVFIYYIHFLFGTALRWERCIEIFVGS